MLIHKLTKIIKQDTDDNISFVERDHPFSGRSRSQVILTFKEQKQQFLSFRFQKCRNYMCA